MVVLAAFRRCILLAVLLGNEVLSWVLFVQINICIRLCQSAVAIYVKHSTPTNDMNF